jgi:hypothetical protein
MARVKTEMALAAIGSWSHLRKFVTQAADRGAPSFRLGAGAPPGSTPDA